MVWRSMTVSLESARVGEGSRAVVEHFDGRIEILHWAEEVRKRSPMVPAVREAA